MLTENYQTKSKSEITQHGAASRHSGEVPDVGVALFDDPQAPAGGWGCVAGEVPRRFSSFPDLRNNVLWITNLDYAAYQSYGRTYANVRRNDYFRTTLSAIAADLGFQIAGAHARDGSAKLCEIASRVINLASQCYAVPSMSSILRAATFYEDLRAILPRSPSVSSAMTHPLESAYQASSTPAPPSFEGDTVFITVRRNRLHHALDVMDLMLPDEGWSTESENTTQGVDRWLQDSMACLVEATVELSSVDPDVADLVAFGAQPGSKSIIRSYISQPELLWMSKLARVHVTSAFHCASRPVPSSVRLPGLLTSDPLYALSYSAGLLAEMHWNAYACQPWSKTGGPNGRAGKSTSSWGVWFRAKDRAICFQMAMEFRRAGFAIFNYGNGSVRIRVPRSRIHELLELSDSVGIAYPSFETVIRECAPGAA